MNAREYLSPLRAARLWLLTAIHAVGWSIVGAGQPFLTAGNVVGFALGAVIVGVALLFLIPSALGAATLLQDDWTDLDGPVPGRAALWLLPSLVVGSVGGTLAASSLWDVGTMGTGAALAAGATIGLCRVIPYYRLMVRALD